MLGDQGRAESLSQEGLKELPDESRFASDRMFCLLRSAEVARERGDSPQAVARVEAAQQTLKQLPFESGLTGSQLLMDVAESYRYAGRYDEANAAFERAAQQLTALGRDDTQTAVTLFNNWGVALLLAGRPQDSERVLHRALEISRAGRSEDAVSPMLLVNYARSLRELHRTSEAADYAERGYAKAQRSGAQVVVGQSLLLRSAIYADMKNLPRASSMLDEVEPKLHRSLPAGHIAFGSLASDRAIIAQLSGDLQAALGYSNQAVSIAEAAMKGGRLGGDYLPNFLVRRSEIELQLGLTDQAEMDATRALDFLRASGQVGKFSSRLGHAYLALGRALEAQGKREPARNAFLAAAENMQDALGPNHPDTRSARLLAESEGQQPPVDFSL